MAERNGVNRYSIVTLFLATFSFACFANQKEPLWNQSDLTRVPKYCAVRLNKGPPKQVERWQRLLTRHNYNRLHHFCFGMIAQNKANSATDKRRRDSYAHRGINEYNYVIKAWPADFKLTWEALGRRGQLLEMKGDSIAAAQSYQSALTANPRYVPAYLALADLMTKLGEKDQAISILKAGIKNAPHAKVLKERLARF